jgi:hypothetical protein
MTEPAQPGYPSAQQPPTPAPFPPQPAPGQPVVPGKVRNPQRRQRIVGIVTVVVILAILGGVLWATRHNASTAKVGDCMKQTGANSLEVVKCDDAKASFKVVGKVEDKTQSEAQFSACDPFEAQKPESVFWQGRAGEKGFVLCLAKTGK